MKKNYSYIGIAFIILVFGIIFIPKIVDRVQNKSTVEKTRLNIEGSERNLSILKINGTSRRIPDFVFLNQDSLEISNLDFKDKVTVVEFFFTTCSTICPVMNRNMRTLDDAFHKREDFAIISITIDPENDTPKKLKQYAENYEVKSMNWHFLTGEWEKIEQLANKGFNIYAAVNPKVADGIEHQGYFALIDKNGFIRSRKDKNGNPMVYYQGAETQKDIKEKGFSELEMLKEDIQKLLEE